MADGDESGSWWSKYNFSFLLDIFLSAKVVSGGNWSCVARVVLPNSNLPAVQGNPEGGGLWLEDVRYLVPAGPNGSKATWVQHTQLIAMPCILTTYFKTKGKQSTLKDGIDVPKLAGGEKLHPLNWSAGIKVSQSELDKFQPESVEQAIDVVLFPPAAAVNDFKVVAGGAQVRIRARFQAANYQFIYRFDLGDDGKVAFGVELTGKTFTDQPYAAHLHQILSVLVPGKSFANAQLLRVNTSAGASQFSTTAAATAIEAKKPFAGWNWHEDGVLAFLAAPVGAIAPTWPELKGASTIALGTGAWWSLDPPSFHPLWVTFPGDNLPDLIALDFKKFFDFANEFPQKDTKQIARTAWEAATLDNINPDNAWQGLASRFNDKLLGGQTPMLVSVLRHLHFPMPPENVQMPPHFVSQTVRLRGSLT